MRLNSKKQEDLVLNNLGFVHFLVRRFDVSPNDYDDLISIGTIGLIKAAQTFDESKNCQFSTYASHCINNEIFMYFRKEKSHLYDVSLNAPIYHNKHDTWNGNDRDLELMDALGFYEESFTDGVEMSIVFEKCISIILNVLSPRDSIVMLYYIADFKQDIIAKTLDLSQSYISRLLTKLFQKIKCCFLNNTKFVEIFKMDIVGNSYLISFSPENVPEFKKNFSNNLQSLQFEKTLSNPQIFCNKNRVYIRVSAYPEAFSFVAKIFQQIYEL